MARLFRSKSCGLIGISEFNSAPPRLYFEGGKEGEGERDESEEEEEYEDGRDDTNYENPISTPFIGPRSRFGGKQRGRDSGGGNQSAVLDILVAVLRKSLITCSVERDDVSSMDISHPTEVRHVSHVTFDRFNGFLGLPTELQPEVPRRVPSASANVFGVSASSMQCSFDNRGNSVPTILLMMQKRLYSEGGLRAEGIFRITAENSHEEYVRGQLNKGVVPRGIDVHCLAGLIKAWLRELPKGVLNSLTPEQVMHCNTEDDCTQLVKLLPQTEAALLDWAINLMADVVEYEQHNKMNARNIAMVFAPNMTQMADPLTALIHAVQVMNFLKTLILKTIEEREEPAANDRLLSSCSLSVNDKSEPHPSNLKKEKSYEQTTKPRSPAGPAIGKFLRTSTLDRLETEIDEIHWSVLSKSDGEEESESISGSNTPSRCKMGALENDCRGEYESGDWLSLRKGVRRLCRHPVFQFNKPAKKTRSIGDINTRGGGGEAWA